MKSRFISFVEIAYSIIFLLFSVYMVFNFSSTVYQTAGEHIAVLLYSVVIVAAVFLYLKFIQKSKYKKTINKALLILAFVAQIFIFMTSYYLPGWDANLIADSAIGGITDISYFAVYPNNIFITMCLRIYIKLTSFLGFIDPLARLVFVNIIFVDFSIYILYLLSKRLFSETTKDITLIFSIAFLGFNPWVSTVYTDTLAMPFPILILYCFVRISQSISVKEKYIFSFVLGAALVVGSLIKPTVVIMAVALVLAFILIKKMQKGFLKNPRVIIRCVLSFIIASIICLVLAFIAQIPTKAHIDIAHEIDISRGLHYFVDTGLRSFGKGHWNEETDRWTADNIKDPNYEKLANERIIELIKSYGFIGMAEHLYLKLLATGTDGTFWFGEEGNSFPEPQQSEDTLRGFMQNYIYTDSDFYQNVVSRIYKAMWLIVCLVSGFNIVGVIKCIKKDSSKNDLKNISIFIAKLSFGGLLLFLLLFESRSRYIFLYLPVVLFAAEFQFDRVIEKIKTIKFMKQ